MLLGPASGGKGTVVGVESFQVLFHEPKRERKHHLSKQKKEGTIK